jgi:hypothetical protein
MDRKKLVENTEFLAGKSLKPGLLGEHGVVLPHLAWPCPNCQKVLAITPCDIANEPEY